MIASFSAPGSPPVRRAALTLLAGLLVLSGCRPASGREAPLTPGEFVEVVVSLREAERGLTEEDSVAVFERRKAEVLERHGVTEEALRGFIVAHEDDVSLLRAVWDSIAQRLKHVPGDPAGDSASAEPEGPVPLMLPDSLPVDRELPRAPGLRRPDIDDPRPDRDRPLREIDGRPRPPGG